MMIIFDPISLGPRVETILLKPTKKGLDFFDPETWDTECMIGWNPQPAGRYGGRVLGGCTAVAKGSAKSFRLVRCRKVYREIACI